MAIFKHKSGGICEVLTQSNIEKLRKNPQYKEIIDKKEKTKTEENKLTEEQASEENK